MKRILVALACAVIIAGIGGYAWWSKQTTAVATTSSGTSISSPQRKDLRQIVECTGSVQSNRDVEIKSKASGQVVNLPFDASDTVKKGDLVIEIDPVEQTRNVQRAEASLTASRAKLAQAVATLAAAEQPDGRPAADGGGAEIRGSEGKRRAFEGGTRA